MAEGDITEREAGSGAPEHPRAHAARLRAPEEKRRLAIRLNRIAGQVSGLTRMLEEDRYCVDILTQVSAVQSALNGFSKELLASHIRNCVADDVRAGRNDSVEELIDLLSRISGTK